MSFPTPQAKLIHYNMAKEIVEDAEANGVVLESEEDFKTYRDSFVERVFLDRTSPRFRPSWYGVGVRANFNRNSMIFWRSSNRERLIEDERRFISEMEERIRKRNEEITELSAMADGCVAELLATDLTKQTSDTVYQFVCEFWCREKGCDIDSFAHTSQFKHYGRVVFERLNKTLADTAEGEE